VNVARETHTVPARPTNLALVKRLAAMLLVLLLTVAGTTTAAPALAQIGPNVPPGLTTPSEDLAAPPPKEDTGITTRQIVLIFGATLAILAIIAWYIMRDARSAAPRSKAAGGRTVSDPTLPDAPRAKTARERERERARKRNKAKAARNQRKRNRPR
jgi:hypothetical protein